MTPPRRRARLAARCRDTLGLSGCLGGSGADARYRRRAVRLLLLLLAVDYADRSVLGAMAPTLQQDFHLSDTQIGALAAVCGIAAAIVTLPLGRLVDRVSRTTLLAASAGVWCLAMGFTGAAAGFAALLGARVLLAAVASTVGPALPSLTGDLVPPAERGRVLGLVESGQLLGTLLGVAVGAVALAVASWRWGFWALAAPGVLLAVGLARLPEPQRGAQDATQTRPDAGEPAPESAGRPGGCDAGEPTPAVRPALEAMLEAPAARMGFWETVRYALHVRTNVLVVVAASAASFFLAGTAAFAVIFAVHQYGVSNSEADLALLVLGLGAVAGIVAGGRAGDRLLAGGHLRGRMMLGAACYVLAPVVLLPALLVSSLPLAVPFLAVGMALLAATLPTLDAVRLDVIVPQLRGQAEAVRTVVRTLVEAFAPLVFGVVADSLSQGGGGLRLTFLMTLPLLALAGLVVAAGTRHYLPDAAAAEVSSLIAADGIVAGQRPA